MATQNQPDPEGNPQGVTDPLIGYERTQTRATVWIAYATIITTVVAVLQFSALVQQNRATHLEQRATLTCGDIHSVVMHPGGVVEARFNVVNYGKLVASEIRGWSWISVLNTPPPDRIPIPDDQKGKGGSRSVLAPGAPPLHPLARKALTQIEASMLDGGKATMYLFHRTVYLDGFGKTRCTQVCFERDAPETYSTCPNNNYMDDCPEQHEG